MTNLFTHGSFVANSGKILQFKVECDALTDEDIYCIARYAASFIRFREVVGVPRGGLRLAAAMEKYAGRGSCVPSVSLPPLIVDDVLTTGGSMERMRAEMNWSDALGFVIFDRRVGLPRTTSPWIKSFWSMGG